MSHSRYTLDESRLLLSLARQSVEAAAAACPPPTIDILALSGSLRESRACFVTLYQADDLRGCTGVLVARSPLVMEVIYSAEQSALHDPRFPPVTMSEVVGLSIAISILTPPTKLKITSPVEILRSIRPGIDGVTLSKGPYRATFLPQVWERVPDPTDFLDLLCQKMGLPRRAWLVTSMDVETYQSEEISEIELMTRQ